MGADPDPWPIPDVVQRGLRCHDKGHAISGRAAPGAFLWSCPQGWPLTLPG